MKVTTRIFSLYTPLLLAAVMPFIVGCGSGDEIVLAPVTGIVTQEGKPSVGAIVEFFPESGRTSVGTTNSEGVYTLKYGDLEGAAVGSCRVQITPGSTVGPSAADQGSDVMAPPMTAPPSIVAMKEKVTVAEGKNTFDFELGKSKTK